MARPTTTHVAIASLGGTITMTGSGGVRPTLDAAQLVASVPGLAAVADVSHHTLAVVPGASLRFEDLTRMVAWAELAVDDGAAGVVVAQGTDTIEETAWFADLHWSRDEPFVVTGAMRPPVAPSADGPANLLAATVVAADPRSRGRGVLVVLDDTVHHAGTVRKEHASALSAFRSALGPAGVVVEGGVEYEAPARRTATVPPVRRSTLHVPTIGTGIDDDGRTLRTLAGTGVDGVVVAGFGAGHVSTGLADAIEEAAASVPLVVTSRTGRGRTLQRTYAFPGSEQDLARRGALLGGWLDAPKARVLLWSLLAAELSGAELRRDFVQVAQRSSGSGRSATDDDDAMSLHDKSHTA